MSRSELGASLSSIAAILVSYGAMFWLLTIRARGHLDLGDRLGWVCAIYCATGAGVFFWARILASVAKKRLWSCRNCRLMPLWTMIPGSVLFFAGGLHWNANAVNLVLYEAIFTGLLLVKLVYPNADTLGPFEREVPPTLFPK